VELEVTSPALGGRLDSIHVTRRIAHMPPDAPAGPPPPSAEGTPATPSAPTGCIVTVLVGQPRTYEPAGDASAGGGPSARPWSSSIVKTAVAGPRRAGRTNIEGDRQADLEHHGGPDKAVLAYAAEHYDDWSRELPSVGFPPGAFGENLSVTGLGEELVCIGDVWTTGRVTFQVSQPRQPCWKLARRLGVNDIVARVQDTLRSGWYLRVLEEGEIEADDTLTLVRRPHPSWTVAEASRVMYGERSGHEAVLELAALPELAESWKRTLRARAAGTRTDTLARTVGPG